MYCIKIINHMGEWSDYYNGMRRSKAYPDKMELKPNKSDEIRKHFKMWKRRESAEKEIEKIKRSIRYVDDYTFKVVCVEDDEWLINWIGGLK